MDILCCPLCNEALHLSVGKQIVLRGTRGPFPGCRAFCEYCSAVLDSSNRGHAHDHCAECYTQDIQEGELTCSSGHQFNILGSVPRFNPGPAKQRRTKLTFDTEWTAFQYRQKIYGHSQEEELDDLFRRMSVNGPFLEGKTVLDAGCGTGRLARSVVVYAREVVGMDFSRGVEKAWSQNRAATNVHIIQGDIMHPPLRASSFDYIYAKGVLHYVPDVKVSLDSLASLVKSGGFLSVTINPHRPPTFETFSRALRKITVRLPIAGVYLLSHALVPLLNFAWAWSGLERRPIEWKERAHMIFNWLSSEHLNTASDGQMRDWFVDLGFDRFRLSGIPVGITGEKSSGL